MEFRACPRNHTQIALAATGSTLCSPCIRQLERHLRALPGLHQEFLHDMSSTSRGVNPTKVTGSRERDHVNVSLFDTRHRILAILESWAGIIVEKLGTAAPSRTVPRLAGFLLRNLEWLTAQPPAADFADEIESLHAESVRTIDADAEQGALTIECVMADCPGTIKVASRNTRNTSNGILSCSSGHSWEMREWLSLRYLWINQRKETA